MCRLRPLPLLLLCCSLGFFQAAARAQEAAVQWRTDYNLVRKEALDKKLPILIDFGTRDCVYCVKLDQTTFRDAKIIGLLNNQFIPLKVDAERDPALAQILQISSYPTLVLAGHDGRILDKMVGYQDAEKFQESLQRILANTTEPDWMQRDYQFALQSLSNQEIGRAISLLRGILVDGRARPIQIASQKILTDLEAKGQASVLRARDMLSKGQTNEAVDALTKTIHGFPGLNSAKEAGDILASLAQNADFRQQQRNKRAQELLTQAQEFYRSKEYIPCLDRCEVLMASFGDLSEGQKAMQLSASIKSDPEWLQNACDVLTDRLGVLYLALADSLAKRGETDRAKMYLERVIRAFPGTRQAESAQIRLGQLAGVPPRRVDLDAAASNNP